MRNSTKITAAARCAITPDIATKSVDELIERQSRETNTDKRRQLVWQIERKLIEEDARPDILYVRGITCRRPYVKDLISMVNSIYNGSRFEDVWLDK